MGQKVRPSGFRLGINREWESNWYSERNYREYLLEDHRIRQFIKTRYRQAGITSVRVERRVGDAVRVTFGTAKPGIVIGRGGAGVDQLRADLEKLTGRKIHVNVQEIKSPDLCAELVAENIASAIERRISFRRVMRQAAQRTMKMGALGVKIVVSGRLGGAEIARSESVKDGKIPLHTIRADIDYGVTAASTKYGPIGVKVWIYKGDVLPGEKVAPPGETRERRKPRARMAEEAPSRRQARRPTPAVAEPLAAEATAAEPIVSEAREPEPTAEHGSVAEVSAAPVAIEEGDADVDA